MTIYIARSGLYLPFFIAIGKRLKITLKSLFFSSPLNLGLPSLLLLPIGRLYSSSGLAAIVHCPRASLGQRWKEGAFCHLPSQLLGGPVYWGSGLHRVSDLSTFSPYYLLWLGHSQFLSSPPPPIQIKRKGCRRWSGKEFPLLDKFSELCSGKAALKEKTMTDPQRV